MPIDSFSTALLVPTEVRSVEITLGVTAGTTANTYTARYTFEQLTSDGALYQVRSGNLIPHLSTSQRATAMNFMDAMLTKAKASIST